MDKMKNILVSLLLLFCCFCNAQTTINLNRSHNDYKKINHFVVDFLQADSTLFISCKIQNEDCRSIKVIKDDVSIVVKTKLLIIVDGQLLSTLREKKTVLSTINKNQIKSLIKIDKRDAVGLYGKKGGNGALVITLIE